MITFDEGHVRVCYVTWPLLHDATKRFTIYGIFFKRDMH